jgi:hypothetical protein
MLLMLLMLLMLSQGCRAAAAGGGDAGQGGAAGAGQALQQVGAATRPLPGSSQAPPARLPRPLLLRCARGWRARQPRAAVTHRLALRCAGAVPCCAVLCRAPHCRAGAPRRYWLLGSTAGAGGHPGVVLAERRAAGGAEGPLGALLRCVLAPRALLRALGSLAPCSCPPCPCPCPCRCVQPAAGSAAALSARAGRGPGPGRPAARWRRAARWCPAARWRPAA